MDAEIPSQVLIIDDNDQVCRALKRLVEKMGHRAQCESSIKGGVQRAEARNFDVVFLDVNLPDGSGFDVIPALRGGEGVPPEIIILTGYGDDRGAEAAVQSQAWDYLQKGASLESIRSSLTRALQYRRQKQAASGRFRLKRDGIVGTSRQIRNCLQQAAGAARNDAPVLLSGETGTGKEQFARAIHENSRRNDGDLVAVDCTTLPEPLVESTLFGHRKGAFTGADKDRDGLIRTADGGTLFLDEIGDLPLGTQKKLLRVLQEKRFRPVGAGTETGSDFRLICATNRDLDSMVESGAFRRDLYYRIKTIAIDLPPLRRRKVDIPPLVLYHLGRRCRLNGNRIRSVSPEFLECLQQHNWPGNVRELFNTLEHALAEAVDEPVLFPRHLPPHIRTRAICRSLQPPETEGAGGTKPAVLPAGHLPLKDYLDKMRFHYIDSLMGECKNDVRTACRLSGISRGHIYQLLKNYGIKPSVS